MLRSKNGMMNLDMIEDKPYSLNPFRWLLETTNRCFIRHVEEGDTCALRLDERRHLERTHDWIPRSLQIGDAEPIAIVGISCRLPGANDYDEFWNLIVHGNEAIGSFPDGRWSKDESKAKLPNAGWLKCPVDEIDGTFFGMSALELSFTDPQQRLLLEVSWEALEDAAIDPTSLQSSTTGIFTGAWTNDYRDLLFENGYADTEFFRTYLGNSHGAMASRLAYFYGSSGPTFATESGCSSSLAAVGLACDSLRHFKSDVALACGVNLILRPFSVEGMQPPVSPTGHCRTFDKDADGYVRAEGCAVLVLKRLSDAAKSGDRIHALIKGYGQAQECKSMGAPTVDCKVQAIRLALRDAGVRPNEVGYVEAHGTGNSIGDSVEIKAIAQAYSDGRQNPLYIGSVKTNIGHTESCSGIIGIIKTILCLKNEVIPPHINLVNINPEINLERIPAIIPLKKIPWGKVNRKKRLAGVSSFGITGIDCHVIIEEAPSDSTFYSVELESSENEEYELLPLSAKCSEGLDLLTEKYEHYLNENSKIPISDIAFTAGIGRQHFDHRAAIIGKNNFELVENLSSGIMARGIKTGEKPRVCFLFTGQGSQFCGMGKTLYEKSPVFKTHMDICKTTLEAIINVSILDVMWDTNSIYSQTSIFCLEYCLLKLWESLGVTPEIVCGHSLGEFAAAVAAEIITLKDALELVVERSILIEKLNESNMLLVNCNVTNVTEIISEFLKFSTDLRYCVDVAAINSENQTVVSGSPISIEKFSEFCKNTGIKTQLLASSHAFHSRDMGGILMKYKAVAEKLNYSKPVCKFISSVFGETVEEIDADYWVNHTRHKVKFMDVCKELYYSGARIFIEIGPQPLLLALLVKNFKKMPAKKLPIVCIPSMNKYSDQWKSILTAVGKLYTNGVDINWDKMYENRKCKKMTLPFYPFQREKYWFKPRSNAFQRSENRLHPLLGFPVCNSTEQKIYQGWINIDKNSYLLDHVIGENIIFPGAAYIEIALSAGYTSTLKDDEKFETPIVPITVKNISFKKPMLIDESSKYELQTIVSGDETSDGWKGVNVFQAQYDASVNSTKWVKLASAKVTLKVESTFVKDHLEELSTLKRRMHSGGRMNIRIFYENLRKVGLHFGPMFKSLKKVYLHDGETLAKIEVPEGRSSYLTHPVVIDAMVQACMVDNDEEPIDTLMVPIVIEKFLWLAKSDLGINYIHVFKKGSIEKGSKVAVLYDSQGIVLAIMEGVTL